MFRVRDVQRSSNWAAFFDFLPPGGKLFLLICARQRRSCPSWTRTPYWTLRVLANTCKRMVHLLAPGLFGSKQALDRQVSMCLL